MVAITRAIHTLAETCKITVISVICPQKAGTVGYILTSAYQYTNAPVASCIKLKMSNHQYRYFVTELNPN